MLAQTAGRIFNVHSYVCSEIAIAVTNRYFIALHYSVKKSYKKIFGASRAKILCDVMLCQAFLFFARLVFFGTSGIEHNPHEVCYMYVDNY